MENIGQEKKTKYNQLKNRFFDSINGKFADTKIILI